MSGQGRHGDAVRPAAFELLEPRLLLTGYPVISEFMADNKGTLKDGFDRYPDWIELYNPTEQAFDLTGWHLTDKADKPTRWDFPAVTLAPGQYLVVFASGENTTDPAGYLHTSFSLDDQGEYLALTMPDGTVVFEYPYPYPQQLRDVSYGLAQYTEALVQSGSAAVWRVPTAAQAALGTAWTAIDFDDSAWTAGATGLGFTTASADFDVKVVKAATGISVNHLTVAQSVLADPSKQAWVRTEKAPVINYLNTNTSARFTGDRTFPGMTIGSNVDDFVVEATGTVVIPEAGDWTFGVNSDDGFRMELTRGSQQFVIEYPGTRGANDTLGVFDITEPGAYELHLVYYERGGGSEVELFAAQGARTAFNSTYFRLVGDTASGGLLVSGLGGELRTDVGESMRGANSSLWLRQEFTFEEPEEFDSLVLRVWYEDGFVAYLNGQEVARRNAPASVQWNSAAASDRPIAGAAAAENIILNSFLGSLVEGVNVLAIHALNDSAANGDFLVSAELVAGRNQPVPHYFTTPTPGQPNVPGAIDYVKPVAFSAYHGFYDAPFQVALSTPTAEAVIRYTTDGSRPTMNHGTTYSGPVTVSTTTILTAAAFRPGWESSAPVTQTYIFLDDVLRQPADPAGFPAMWGTAVADYAMDPNIVNDPAYSATIKDDLRSIPTLSLVMDQADIFGPNGLYSNPKSTGSAWERACSAELIYPDGSTGFQVNCGARIYGGVCRDPRFPKHTFRLIFTSEYGPTKLEFPLFGPGAVDEFDQIIIRGNFNNSWPFWDAAQRQRSQSIRDQWVHNTQLAMGWPSSHGTFVHLYINGLYWGLYNPVERPNASFQASYLGGDKEDYDALNSYPRNVVDGTADAWLTANAIAAAGVSDQAGYDALAQYVNIPNLVDYIILNFYGGNRDWDDHNWYAGRLQEDGAGYMFFCWDGERTLEDPAQRITGTRAVNKPTYLHSRLSLNSEYRMLFADQAHKHLFNDGALTPDRAIERWMLLADEVYQAMVGESARWGDYIFPDDPYTRNEEWLTEQNRLLTQYFPVRTDNVIAWFRDLGLYPQTNAPVFHVNGAYRHGGRVSPGDLLAMSATTGTVYYTLDGGDPRLPGGGISPKAHVLAGGGAGQIVLDDSVWVKARVLNNGEWSALNEAIFELPAPPPLAITELHYNPAAATPEEAAAGFPNNDHFEFIEIRNVGDRAANLSTVRFIDGVDFSFAGSAVTVLAPGAFVVVVSNGAAFELRYGPCGAVAGQYTGNLSNGGERLVLAYGLGTPFVSFRYGDGDSWPGRADGCGASLELIDPGGDYGDADNWRSSSPVGGTPAAEPAPRLTGVVINEVLSHTDLPQRDAIELYNASDRYVDLGGWYLSDSSDAYPKFRIPDGTLLGPGEYITFDEDDFNISGGVDPTDFALNSAHGDDVWLMAPDAQGRLCFADHVDFGAAANGESFGRWPDGTGRLYPMTEFTPFGPNSGPRVGPVVISEIHYHPPETAGEGATEFVEIFNATSGAVALADWRITGGITYDFDPTATLEPFCTLVVVPFDPSDAAALAAFRAAYGLDASVQPVGPYLGQLSNGGERVRLERPDEPPPDDLGFIPHLLEDEADYDDDLPWPAGPDGQGQSLHRLSPTLWGNSASHWGGAAPSPGLFAPPAPQVAELLRNDGLQRPSELRSLSIRFSQDVSSMNPAALALRNESTGQDIPLDGVAASYDAQTNTARWDLSGVAIEPGYYTVTLPCGAVQNCGGTPLDDGNGLGFGAIILVAMPGDANQDGKVARDDLLVLKQHFGRTGDSWAGGDFDYDGVIGLLDYLAVKENYGRMLAAPAAPLGAVPPPSADQPAATAQAQPEAELPQPAPLGPTDLDASPAEGPQAMATQPPTPELAAPAEPAEPVGPQSTNPLPLPSVAEEADGQGPPDTGRAEQTAIDYTQASQAETSPAGASWDAFSVLSAATSLFADACATGWGRQAESATPPAACAVAAVPSSTDALAAQRPTACVPQRRAMGIPADWPPLERLGSARMARRPSEGLLDVLALPKLEVLSELALYMVD